MRKLILPALLGCTVAAQAQDRPNILWLTIEDSSASLFGCYGNEDVKTPVIDDLASKGIRYTYAWSVAPQSSPARSSIITGCYATTYAMDFHRNSQATPAQIYFPQLLREAGYFCTNNTKTDYNSANNHKACWDECSPQATYNSEARGDKPFFSVFNTTASHMGRIRSFHQKDRRDYRKEGLDMDKLTLPPHVPDLKEVRCDYAGHLEGIQDIDEWVSYFLADLEAKGLADNTIVFFYSDHGGCLPRGKGYLNETGLRVPFIVYFPEKWQHLAAQEQPAVTDRLIGFTDLAPTVLSLAGVDIPENQFQGEAFLGEAMGEERDYLFGFTSNQHHNYMPSRAVSDGRYKYIRSYMPYKHASLRNYYQWGMPSNMAWDELVLSGKTTDPVLLQPYQHRKGEVLYDLESDPFELTDISQRPDMQAKLAELRGALSQHIRDTKDLGFVTPAMRGSEVNLHQLVRQPDYDLMALYDLVERASTPQLSDVPYFAEYLTHDKCDFRLWAATGLAELASTGQRYKAPEALVNIVNDPDDYVAAEGCFALVYLNENREAALKRLVTPKNEEYRKAGYSLLECLALDKSMHAVLKPCVAQLRESAKVINIKYNEDAGMVARGVLVNLGELTMPDVYGKEGVKIGYNINRGRRAKLPLPANNPQTRK